MNKHRLKLAKNILQKSTFYKITGFEIYVDISGVIQLFVAD